MAKTTLSVIKADIGSMGGHIMPSRRLVERVAAVVADGADLIERLARLEQRFLLRGERPAAAA